MVRHTFLDKTNTIFRGSSNNFGLHPVCMLNYGGIVSRIILHFDEKKLIDLGENVRHFLKMMNCGSYDVIKQMGTLLPSEDVMGVKERGESFDIIAVRLPQGFDEGNGFDRDNDFWGTGYASVSNESSNWYYSQNGIKWEQEGIFTRKFIDEELVKFGNNEKSVIVARQHFEHGNENLKLDITEYVNDVLSGSCENNGLCLMFIPMIERLDADLVQYVGFWSNKTNTLFHPFIESISDISIQDDRYDFIINKENRLYLFSNIGGELCDLDELPQCRIEGSNCDSTKFISEVKRFSKGVYYVDILMDSNTPIDSIYYDIWSNIKYNGVDLGEVEQEFVTHPQHIYFSIGENVDDNRSFEPSITNINDYEKIQHGEKRNVKVEFKRQYTTQSKTFNQAYYRIYVKDGQREFTIFDWNLINNYGKFNDFTIYGDDFICGEYHVDIKLVNNNEVRVYNDKLTFEIVNDISDRRI